jgi:hypothetical protein
MHHRTISQHRQIETRPVKRDKLRLTLTPTNVSTNSFSNHSPICGAPDAFTCHEPSVFFRYNCAETEDRVKECLGNRSPCEGVVARQEKIVARLDAMGAGGFAMAHAID